MKEYWVNVYKKAGVASAHSCKAASNAEALNMRTMFKDKCLYRIHVKMKPILPLELKEAHDRFFQR